LSDQAERTRWKAFEVYAFLIMFSLLHALSYAGGLAAFLFVTLSLGRSFLSAGGVGVWIKLTEGVFSERIIMARGID
jgi:hypothetical protein